MKFYNYFSNEQELKNYLQGKFSGKGIYFDPDEFQAKETLRSKLRLYSRNDKLLFYLSPQNKKTLYFTKPISEISNIKEDFCEFQANHQLIVKIQAMTKKRLHIHISSNQSKIHTIYISGILSRSFFHFV